MRKYLLLIGAGCIGWLTTGAQAACPVFPTCEEMGYTMTETDCSGRATLKCPSDWNKVFCGAEKSSDGPVECQIGSVLYNDLKCYDEAPNGKTAIAVVFDHNKKLAIALDHKSSIQWGGYGTDISGLDNCSRSNYSTCSTDGKNNTQKIVSALGTGSDYAAGYCYNKTDGGLSKGSWFLPSIVDLKLVFNNKTTINAAMTAAGGTKIPDGGTYWSSTEVSSTAAFYLYLYYGDVSNDFKYFSNSNFSARCAVAY